MKIAYFFLAPFLYAACVPNLQLITTPLPGHPHLVTLTLPSNDPATEISKIEVIGNCPPRVRLDRYYCDAYQLTLWTKVETVRIYTRRGLCSYQPSKCSDNEKLAYSSGLPNTTGDQHWLTRTEADGTETAPLALSFKGGYVKGLFSSGSDLLNAAINCNIELSPSAKTSVPRDTVSVAHGLLYRSVLSVLSEDIYLSLPTTVSVLSKQTP